MVKFVLASAHAAEVRLGLSLRKLASRLGVDPATIQGWVAGEHQPTAARMDEVMQIIRRL